MDNSPKITRKFRLAGLLVLPLGGVLLGTGALCLWLQTKSPLTAEQVLSRPAQVEHLQIITTNSLYMNDFKAPSLAHEAWEAARDLIYARVPSALGSSLPVAHASTGADADKTLSGLLLSVIRVHEAHAQTTQTASTLSPDGKVTPVIVRMAESDRNKDKGQNADPNAGQTNVRSSSKNVAKGQEPQGKVSSEPAPAQATAQATGQASAPATSVSVATAPQAPQVPQIPQAQEPAAPPREAAKPAESAAKSFPQSFTEGTLGHMTQLRAELEQLKLQVTIEEARSRLNQLRGNSFTPAARMPSLEYPPIGMPGGAVASHDNGMRILSIQSVNGKFTATVGTASGPRVVSNGDAINGNKVVSISRNSVVINRGEGNETLSIQD